MAKPFVLLKLDKDYEFRLNNKAGYYYKQLTGKSIEQNLQEMGTADFNEIIYAGLKCIDKDITLENVLDLIDEHMDCETLAEIVNKALEASTFFPVAKSQKETHPAKK